MHVFQYFIGLEEGERVGGEVTTLFSLLVGGVDAVATTEARPSTQAWAGTQALTRLVHPLLRVNCYGEERREEVGSVMGKGGWHDDEIMMTVR